MHSVLGQLYSNIEYLIIDGNSTDGTQARVGEVAAQYPDRNVRLISEPDQGLYHAMNKGIALAKGEVVGILNADDLFANDQVLEKIMKIFTENSTDAVYADLIYTPENNIRRVSRYWKSNVYRKNSFLWGWMPPHPSFFVKREIYQKFGTFNTQFRIAADYEILLRFLHIHQISSVYLPEITTIMREGGVSNANLKNRVQANTEDIEAWKVNGIKPYFFTMWLKPLRKISQFIWKP